MVLVMVLPSLTIVDRIASVVTATEEAAAPAAPKMVVLPIVLVIVLPSETMVVRTGAVEMAELLPPLVPLAPEPLAPVPPAAALVAVPVAPLPPALVPLPPWVKASVALRTAVEEAPVATGKE